MDDQRFRELENKRDTEGLSDQEADELGRMIAEREGRAYANARGREHPEASPGEDEKPASQAELEEMRERPDVQVDDAPAAE